MIISTTNKLYPSYVFIYLPNIDRSNLKKPYTHWNPQYKKISATILKGSTWYGLIVPPENNTDSCLKWRWQYVCIAISSHLIFYYNVRIYAQE